MKQTRQCAYTVVAVSCNCTFLALLKQVVGGLAVESTDILAEALRFKVTHKYAPSFMGLGGAMGQVKKYTVFVLERHLILALFMPHLFSFK